MRCVEVRRAIHLLKAARRQGFHAEGVRSSLSALKKLHFPMILFWDHIHYVVLEGIKSHRYYVNDPAEGQRVFSEEEFQQKFTGICLLFEPRSDFKATNRQPPSNISIIKDYIMKSIPEYTFLCLITGMLVCFGVFLPFFVKNLFDNVITGHTSGSLNHYFLIPSCIIFLLSLCFTYLQKIVVARLERRISLTEARRILSHALKLPLTFFGQRSSGDLAQHLSSVEGLSLLLGLTPVLCVLSIISIVVYGVIMFFYSSFMATIVCLFAIFYIFVFSIISKKLTEQSKKMGNEMGRSYGWSADAIKVIDTIQSNGSSSFCELTVS